MRIGNLCCRIKSVLTILHWMEEEKEKVGVQSSYLLTVNLLLYFSYFWDQRQLRDFPREEAVSVTSRLQWKRSSASCPSGKTLLFKAFFMILCSFDRLCHTVGHHLFFATLSYSKKRKRGKNERIRSICWSLILNRQDPEQSSSDGERRILWE